MKRFAVADTSVLKLHYEKKVMELEHEKKVLQVSINPIEGQFWFVLEWKCPSI